MEPRNRPLDRATTPHAAAATAPAPPHNHGRGPHVGPLRARLSSLFDVTHDSRERTVAAMLDRHARDSAAYWLQLLLAMGIATLGLVLDSTGVVIGAMLISPLMGPIVELGMGLAAGSGFLAMRSAVRAGGSVGVVVFGAMAVTALLPIHEVTREISARTSPTVLDLFVAQCCALAAAFAVVRPSVETASTAAGTAIGIALVPPLCVVGYGLGTRQAEVARGSALLFTANFSAIILFALLWFKLLGFDTVPVKELEERALSGDRGDRRMARTAQKLRDVFGARYGRVLRVVMPLVLVGAVYSPLRGALEEVAWQERVRAGLARMIAEAPVAQAAVRQVVVIERHTVALRLVVVSSPEQAERLERDLQNRVAALAGVVPSVTVTAVPDYASLRATAAVLQRPAVAEAPAPPTFDETARRVGEALREAWPTREAGPLLQWRLSPEGAGTAVEVTHLGAPLGAALPLLSRALSASVGVRLVARDIPLSAEAVTATTEEGARWLAALSVSVESARRYGLSLCARSPSLAALEARPDLAAIQEAARERLATLPAGRWVFSPSDGWSATLTAGHCPAEEATPAATGDGGATSDAAR